MLQPCVLFRDVICKQHLFENNNNVKYKLNRIPNLRMCKEQAILEFNPCKCLLTILTHPDNCLHLLVTILNVNIL